MKKDKFIKINIQMKKINKLFNLEVFQYTFENMKEI